MGIGSKMPDGTRVKDAAGRVGATVTYLANMAPSGGYKVKWDDDASETEVRIHQLELEAGAVSLADYNAAVALVVTRLGGLTERAEGNWSNGASVLVIAHPAYLASGESLHAHVSPARALHKVHIKSGETRVRDIFKDGKLTADATADDETWMANYKLRSSLLGSKQAYLDSKLALPV